MNNRSPRSPDPILVKKTTARFQEEKYNSRMTPPFPAGLSPSAARRQAVVLLLLFYGCLWGGEILLGGAPLGFSTPIVSALGLAAVMLLATALFVRDDTSWRESLGLQRQPLAAVLGRSFLGFLGTYAVNMLLMSIALTFIAPEDLAGVAATRVTRLEPLANLPGGAILPLAAFVALWEETVFRGFLLGRLRAAIPSRDTRGARRRRDALAVLVAALFFGLGHGYQGGLGLAQTTLAGVALGALAIWSRGIWPAIGAHLAIDAIGLVALKALASLLGTATFPM